MLVQKLCTNFLLFFLLYKKKLVFTLFFLSLSVLGDSFEYNTYNNHGVVGLINMPSARFFEEAAG